MAGNNDLDYSFECEFLLNATQSRDLGKNNPNLLGKFFFLQTKRKKERKWEDANS